ncbi:MAG: cell wall-binding repeat-containing protein, partial [Lachnospiraceae bacterium]|nr:cell wall-binding repeat-containing protein [Lachnospiraceae bacterium]
NPIPTKNGDAFKGWYNKNNEKIDFNNDTITTENLDEEFFDYYYGREYYYGWGIVLKAKWDNAAKNDLGANANKLFGDKSQLRIGGADRCETAQLAADNLKTSLGIDKFDVVIVASGDDFPDALAGGYLASKTNAPILLLEERLSDSVTKYIKENISETGRIYILGGPSVVSSAFEERFENEVIRLWGMDRYETNLEILYEAEAYNEDLMVCTGEDFPDSLSASAVPKPILLVNKEIDEYQLEYLYALETNKNIYIIGGGGVVSSGIEDDLKECTSRNIKRLAGNDRYGTSKCVAEEFFASGKNVIFADASDFPDGLSGGPLAMSIGSPMMLVDNGHYTHAEEYVDSAKATKGIVMGGPKLISDETINKIMSK